MQIHEGLSFPASAVVYLQRHKPDQTDVDAMCARQATRVRKQFDDLSKYLAKDIKRVLDIGCGLGAIDAIIANERNITALYLVDGDGTVERHGEYRDVSEPWNNVADAVEFVQANTSKMLAVVPEWPERHKVDIVLSLKSWGLHYPVETYLNRVPDLLESNGVLVLDLHRPEACIKVEQAGFSLVGMIGSYDEPGRAIIPFVRHIFKKVA